MTIVTTRYSDGAPWRILLVGIGSADAHDAVCEMCGQLTVVFGLYEDRFGCAQF